MKTNQPLLDYLATCSENSLQAFELVRLNEAAALRQQLLQQICAIVDEMVEADTQARLARWICDQRRLAIGRPLHCVHESHPARRSQEIRRAQPVHAFLLRGNVRSREGPRRRAKRLLQLLRVPGNPCMAQKSGQMLFAAAS